MSFKKIQEEQQEWSDKNFDNKKPYQPILGAAEEVASAILYLSSPDAGFITGIALPVDGGSVAGG